MLTEDSKMENEVDLKAITTGRRNDEKIKYVGQSKFYETTPNMVTPEKQDPMKPDDYVEEGELKSIFFKILDEIHGFL